MDKSWNQIIQDLIAAGMTQRRIAEAIGVTQGTVSQVLNGNGRRGFRFEPGQKLVALHRREMRRPTPELTPQQGEASHA